MMKKKKTGEGLGKEQANKDRLSNIREALLKLHKVLADSERISYEKTFGQVQSPGHFLQLLTRDPWFAWLHPLSLLVVAMDEALDADEPLTESAAEALFQETRRLLIPSESGEGFARHYFEALQRDPDVVLTHAETTKLIGQGKREK
jgi:hypothetical protein